MIVSIENSCAGASPKPNTTINAKITNAIPMNNLALPAKFVTIEIQLTPLIQTYVAIQNNTIETNAIINVELSPTKTFVPKSA